MVAAWSWYGFWLVLHVLGVIVAFGPTLVMFPVIARRGQLHPESGAFAVELLHFYETKVVIPIAVIVPLAGVGLIYTGHVDFWGSGWLVASTVLYIAAFFFAITVQTRNSARMLELLRAMPPGPPPAGAEPPAEIAALGRKLQLGGQYLALSVLVILVLMIGGREGWFR